MDLDTTKVFNDRLAQWVAKQGFWFQLRYSMAGGGISVMLHHIMRMILKLAIFSIIFAAFAIAYLVKRTDQHAFDKQLKNGIVAWFDASSGKMHSFDLIQNKASIRHLVLNGSTKSLFDRCEATGITFRMGLLDIIIGTWNANQISVDRLSLSVKAGAESQDEADALTAAISKKFDKLKIQSFECKNTHISWGYSARTMGLIDHSSLTAIHDDQGWQLHFKGGTFSQNWLQNLEIKELILRLTHGELIVEKGEFVVSRDPLAIANESPGGRVYFQSVAVKGGLRPKLTGKIILDNVPLTHLLQQSYQAYAEGVISGELELGGSTNSRDGVTLQGRISLKEGDGISLRNRIPLLNSLSILSPIGGYRKVNLTQGSFHIKTGAGKMTIDHIQLLAPGQMEIKGNFVARPATSQEIDDMLRKNTINSEVAEKAIDELAVQGAAYDMTIGKAAEILASSGQTSMGFDNKRVDHSLPFQAELNEKQVQMRLAENLALTAMYEGELYLTLPVASFPNDELTIKKLPRASDSSVIFLECPLRGNLDQLTLTQADALMIVDREMKKTTDKSAPTTTQ